MDFRRGLVRSSASWICLMAFSESGYWVYGIGDSQRRIQDSDCSRTRHYQCSKVGDCFSESPIPNPESRISVSKRLAGLEHVPDARLGLLLLRELDEVLALQAQQPFLVDHGSAVDFAAAQHGGDAGGDLEIGRAHV